MLGSILHAVEDESIDLDDAAHRLRLGAVQEQLPRTRSRSVRSSTEARPNGSRSASTCAARSARSARSCARTIARALASLQERTSGPRTTSNRGARRRRAAFGTSTRCIGKSSAYGKRSRAGRTSRRCRAARATRATAAAARESILELFATWDHLAERRALPDQLHVLELGVGNGNQARVWLDEFLRVDRELGPRLLPAPALPAGRLLAASARDRPRAACGTHAEHVSALVLDAMAPSKTLGFLKYKAFFVYISNVYDNLPTDEIARIDGHLFQVETRAYPRRRRGRAIAAAIGATADELPELIAAAAASGAGRSWPRRSRRALPTRSRRCASGAAVWEAIGLEERYVAGDPRRNGTSSRPGGRQRDHAVGRGSHTATSGCTSATGPRRASSIRCRCCTRTACSQCHDIFVTDTRRVRERVSRPGEVRRLGRELGERPGAGRASAGATASRWPSAISRTAPVRTSRRCSPRCANEVRSRSCCRPRSSARTPCRSGWDG